MEEIDLRKFTFPMSNDNTVMGQMYELVEQSFRYWRDAGLLRVNDTRSFGVVAKIVAEDKLGELDFNRPESLVDFAILYGDEGGRYAANALRKLRAAARTGQSTQDMQKWPALFQDVVAESDLAMERDGGPIPWGDFPYAGAVILRRNDVCYLVAVSGFTEKEDHWLATLLAEFLALKNESAE